MWSQTSATEGSPSQPMQDRVPEHGAGRSPSQPTQDRVLEHGAGPQHVRPICFIRGHAAERLTGLATGKKRSAGNAGLSPETPRKAHKRKRSNSSLRPTLPHLKQAGIYAGEKFSYSHSIGHVISLIIRGKPQALTQNVSNS